MNSMLTKNKTLIPNATAFIASFCIMVIEIAAGRIIARYLGTSLYTWTSVIGVVLAGIAIGNYIGGRLADKYESRKLLSLLFVLASIGCVTVPVLNKIIGNFHVLWMMPWIIRIAVHVTAIFLLPSVILGLIAPVVAKFALDQGGKPGRTVGNVYAWGAAGSIVGTFVTGFILVAVMSTGSIVFSVAVLLVIVSMLYGRKAWFTYLWIFSLITLLGLSMSSASIAQNVSQSLGFRGENDPSIIYEGESRYSHILVRQLKDLPEMRELILDGILHNVVDMKNPGDIYNVFQYPYMGLYGAVTDCLAKDKKDLRVLVIGGGGYVFPRYMREKYSGSKIDVVEIDPAVTDIAIKTLGLSEKSGLNIYHMDARNHIDDLLRKSEERASFDFIYGDAISGLSVPYQLTTVEFNEKIRKLLTPEGVYFVNVIDNYSSGRFLGSLLNTLRETFPHIYVYSTEKKIEVPSAQKTFVVICAIDPIGFEYISMPGFDGVLLGEENLKYLDERSGGMVLTDEFAPVDTLLAPVSQERGVQLASVKMRKEGDEMAKQKNSREAIRFYNKALKLNPNNSGAYNNLANVLAGEGRFEEAVDNYMKAVELAPRFVLAFHNLGMMLTRAGKLKEAEGYFKKAIELRPDFAEAHYGLGVLYSLVGVQNAAVEQYQEAVRYNPGLAEAYYALGNVFFSQGRLDQALEKYEKAIEIKPMYVQAYSNAGAIMEKQGRLEEAISYFEKAVEIAPNYKQAEDNLKAALSQKKMKESEIIKTDDFGVIMDTGENIRGLVESDVSNGK